MPASRTPMMPPTQNAPAPAELSPQPLSGEVALRPAPQPPAANAGPDPRPWIAVAAIASGGGGIGFAQGRGWFASPLVRQVLIAAAILAVAASLAALFRRGEARRRIAAGVQQFGGGTYGVAAFCTWLYLEGQALAGDWTGAGNFGDFVDGRLGEWLIGFSQQSLRNLLDAALWPLFWLREGGVGVAVLVAGCAWIAIQIAARRSAAAG